MYVIYALFLFSSCSRDLPESELVSELGRVPWRNREYTREGERMAAVHEFLAVHLDAAVEHSEAQVGRVRVHPILKREQLLNRAFGKSSVVCRYHIVNVEDDRLASLHLFRFARGRSRRKARREHDAAASPSPTSPPPNHFDLKSYRHSLNLFCPTAKKVTPKPWWYTKRPNFFKTNLCHS